MYQHSGAVGIAPELMPFVVGRQVEQFVGAQVQPVVDIDAGSDIDHQELLFTWEAVVQPGVPDTPLASSRLAAYTGGDVWRSGIVGATGLKSYMVKLAAGHFLTTVHIGLQGAGPFTAAAGNIVVPGQTVVASYQIEDQVCALRVVAFAAYPAAGSNKRYRRLVITPYAVSAGGAE